MPSRNSIKLNPKTVAQIQKEERHRRKERQRVLKLMTPDFYKNNQERLEDENQ